MFPLAMVGKVVSTQDPEALGRVQVRLLGYKDQVDLWLRMVMPYASKDAGFVFFPEIDDEVLVLRGPDDVVDGMFVLGALYNGARVPTYTNGDGDNITKVIQTRAGNHLTFSDKDGEEGLLLKTKAGNLIELTDKSGANGVTIKNADGTIDIALDTNGVKISVASGKGAKIDVAGDATLSAQGQVSVKSGTNLTVEAGANLTCKGSANASLEAGAQLTVKGGAMVSVEAPLIKLN